MSNCQIARKLQFRKILFWEENKSKEIEIFHLLTVLLSIPLYKLALTNGLDPFFAFHFWVDHRPTSTKAIFCKFALETYFFSRQINWCYKLIVMIWREKKIARNNVGLSCNWKRKSELTNGLDPFFAFHFRVVRRPTSTNAVFRKFATKRLRILSSFWHSIYIRTISS